MSTFAILKPHGKGMEVLAAYRDEEHRDKVLEKMREDSPEETFVAQNPLDSERADDDPKRTF